jgi:beta-lactamase superfamily II metal-dependent hydrolase
MKYIKKVTAIVLLISVLLSQTIIINAASTQYTNYAEKLAEINVFQGTANGFELDREPTRLEGMVMLIRLLGKETDAKALSNQTCVFTDVPSWGVGYANYAYNNKLTTGIGNNLFGTTDNLNAKAYMTFLLRALGYEDSKGDFTYNDSIEFSKSIGLIDNELYNKLNTTTFLRDHIAKSSYDTLLHTIKGSKQTLAEKLITENAISETIAKQIGVFGASDIGELQVHFIDVGQALAILIEDDFGNHILYDAGNNGDDDTVINYLKSQQVDDLEYIIVSHTDEDHLGAMDSVLEAFEVENAIMTSGTAETESYKDVMTAITRERLQPIYVDVNDKFELGDIDFQVLGPINDKYSDPNEYSIVVMFKFGDTSFLLTGDAEIKNETEMINNNTNLKADVLQIGHHGSDSSTSLSFLNAVNPTQAIISCGKDNKYGHPTNATLQTLASKEVEIFRTDLHGTIIVTTDGYFINFNVGPIDTKIIEAIPDNTTFTNTGVIISTLDKVNELITIKNISTTDVDVTGWKIISITGNQTYTFPSYLLKGGASVTVASGDAAGILKWGKSNIWNNSQSDPAELYDSTGKLIYKFND